MARRGKLRWKGFDYRTGEQVTMLRTEWLKFMADRTTRRVDDDSLLVFERMFDARTRRDMVVLVAEVYDKE
jgi:hypothetical protein